MMKLRSGAKLEDEARDEMAEKSELINQTQNGNGLNKDHGNPDSHYRTIFGYRICLVTFITHVNIALYACCFWIQLGTMPYLSKKLGVDPVMFGYLQTTFAVVQLAGGPLYGRFGDLYGGRAAMTLAFASCSLTYGLLGLSYSIPFLFLSRLPSVFMHAMQGGQMVITDMSKPEDRADGLGKLGLSYGIGMVCGPVIGGLITKYSDERMAAFAACGGSLVSIVLVYVFIPSVTKRSLLKGEAPAPSSSGESVFSLKKLASLFSHPNAVTLLIIKTVTGVPIGIFQSMFSVIAIEYFKMPAETNGYVLSYVGVISMIVQGVGIGIFTKRFSEMGLIKTGVIFLVGAYFLLAYVIEVWQLCVVLIPMTIGLTFINVVVPSALTKTVDDKDTGAMLGVNMAVNSAIRSVSPFIGGYMLNSLGFPSFGWFGCVDSIVVALVLFAKFR